MKKFGITFLCLLCFDDDRDAFSCSGTFFFGGGVNGRSGQECQNEAVRGKNFRRTLYIA